MRCWPLAVFLLSGAVASGQIDSTLLRGRATADTSGKRSLNMDAVYRRPFLTFDQVPVSLGGYVEAKAQHIGTDGVSDGLSFALQRMTLFVASSIGPRLRFLTEVELEEGGREIALEFAALDLELHPLFALRGGVIMTPIGAFNQNHDGPKWEFTDRPLAAVRMLPATWSNTGFGVHGKRSKGAWTYGYEAYLTNGFDATIICNAEGRTFLPASKDNPDRFTESANGVPLVSAKVAVRHERMGEVGISTMGGVFNQFKADGLTLDRRRRVDVVAIDFNTVSQRWGTSVLGEWAWVVVDVPATYSQQFGTRQRGGFVDVVQPVLRRRVFGFNKAVLNLALRLGHVDHNVGRFKESGTVIGDEVLEIVPGLSFRPVPGTVIRLNYRIERAYDLFRDPPARTGGFQFGVASYF